MNDADETQEYTASSPEFLGVPVTLPDITKPREDEEPKNLLIRYDNLVPNGG